MTIFEDLGKHLNSSETTKKLATKGNCRIWTRAAFLETVDWTEQNQVELVVEAREIIVDPSMSHTFLRVSDGQTNYIYDGTGLPRSEPWSGEEQTSPYKNSKADPIQSLLETEVKQPKQSRGRVSFFEIR